MDKENYRPFTAKKSNPNRQPKPVQNHSQSQPHKQANGKDYHDRYMRYLIASNAQYFQSKLKLGNKGKSKDMRFKIPCATGMTIYKKDYIAKQQKYNKDITVKHSMSTDCIKTNNFLKDQTVDLRISNKTNYQKQFKYHPVKTEYCRRLKKRLITHNEDDNAPRFLQTQNKTDFLDWAGRNYVSSMRPSEKSAATNLPFQATTVYKSDFEGKSTTPTPIVARGSSYPNFGSISMMMKSNYSSQFGQKRVSGCEVSCKPKHIDASLCKQFKGTTEYKRQFISCRKQQTQEDEAYTIEDMQTLIIDL